MLPLIFMFPTKLPDSTFTVKLQSKLWLTALLEYLNLLAVVTFADKVEGIILATTLALLLLELHSRR